MMQILLMSALVAFPGASQTTDPFAGHTITIPHVRILFYGKQPPYSGYLHTWRKIVILEYGTVQRDIWVTWLSDDSAPPLDAICDITFHTGKIDGTTFEYADPFQPHALLNTFKCQK